MRETENIRVGTEMISKGTPRSGAFRVRVESEPFFGAFGQSVRVTVLDGPFAGTALDEMLVNLSPSNVLDLAARRA